VLAAEDLTIRFGGHAAVDGVTCQFHPGILTAIVGPNGAGKTTFFNLLSGQLPASSGRVLLGGQDVTRLPAPARALRGMGRAFQLTQLFPRLSVLENVRLVAQSRHRQGGDCFHVWSGKRGLIAAAEECLGRVKLTHRALDVAGTLSHGDQRKLEVAMLLALEPDIFLFDEPTAGMSVDEMPVVLDLIRAIRADKSKTVILVEHKMDVVRELADRIIVLHQGRLVADGEPAQVIASPIVQEAYLGVPPDA
jgi:branched-chain amino acid transport system ATP-binding protein